MGLSADAKKNQVTQEGFIERSHVAICKAAADSLRLDILRVLSRDSFGVQELAHIFSIPQPGMSHHLKILFKSGLLVTRRQGNSIFYRRPLLKDQTPLDVFQSSLYSTIDALPIDEQYSVRIGEVYKERSLQSREFFEKNADSIEKNQGLLCEPDEYLSNLKELLDLIPQSKTGRALEVGPGSGLLLEELSRRFEQLVALDSSPEMLNLTKGKVKTKANQIEFINSSLENYSVDSIGFDVVVLNMVMHHMASPAKAFQKLSHLVNSSGFLLVADLSSHNQEWVRDSCGDTWLGFDSHELNEWATHAGFKEEQSSYLGLKNGFQIQLKLFAKV